jgi:hypothetical protein
VSEVAQVDVVEPEGQRVFEPGDVPLDVRGDDEAFAKQSGIGGAGGGVERCPRRQVGELSRIEHGVAPLVECAVG